LGYARSVHRRLLFVALGLVAPAAVAAGGELTTAYATLWEGRYSTHGVAVPAGGQRFDSDVASWLLRSGEWRAMEPVAGGRVAGCVFRGDGRFRLELPDSRERAAFARFAESAERDPIELDFDLLVLRAANGECERLAGATAGPFAADAVAAERRRIWIERALFDVEAAAVRALAGDASGWLVAEMRTPEHGWLLFTFDPDLDEEVGLARFDEGEDVYEPWVSLDRAADRAADGRPGAARRRQIDLADVTLDADLRRPAKYPKAGLADIVPRRARFEATLAFRPLRPELRTLALELDPWCELVAVRDEAGRDVAFLRDHAGGRSSGLPDEIWDDALLLLFEAPVGAAERRLSFVWERDILNYVAGRGWYPGERDGHADAHTATIGVLGRPKHDLRAMGRLEESRDDADGTYRRWRVDRPVRVITFAFAERFEEQRVEVAGQPAVVVFSAQGGEKQKVRNVGADVANAWSFFARRFGPGPESDELLATSIVGGHGQAFEGFLHLAEGSFEVDRPGATELFRAHETAHQWWGHLVGWASPRDLWLSEGFSEYSALLFVEATMKDGAALYREAIESYTAAVMGETKLNRFDRGFSPPANARHWRQVGPIALGPRASTLHAGAGYQVQTYFKGALVLHMLRHLLRAKSGDDELFEAVLADFARDFRRRQASTADFVATLARRAPADWSWFFAQWIDAPEIPTWEWSWRQSPAAGGGAAVEIELEQRGAPAGFRMPVTVEMVLADGERAHAHLLVDEPAERWTLSAPGRVRKVLLDPELAVLARKRER
jgi:hypothetical protein